MSHVTLILFSEHSENEGCKEQHTLQLNSWHWHQAAQWCDGLLYLSSAQSNSTCVFVDTRFRDIVHDC